MGRHFPRAMAPCKNEALHFYKVFMQIIKITKDMVFLMETENALELREQEHILEQWKKVFPNNPLVIAKRGTLNILEKTE